MATKNTRLLQTISLTDYCNNKSLRQGSPFIIRKGKGYHVLGGVEIAMGTFDKLYPVPQQIFYRENSNTKDNWKNKPE